MIVPLQIESISSGVLSNLQGSEQRCRRFLLGGNGTKRRHLPVDFKQGESSVEAIQCTLGAQANGLSKLADGEAENFFKLAQIHALGRLRSGGR